MRDPDYKTSTDEEESDESSSSSSSCDEKAATVFNSGDISRNNSCLGQHEGISIRRSGVCRKQNGAYLNKGHSIGAGEAFTIYPGVYRVLQPGTSLFRYGVSVNAFPNSMDKWVLDARHLKTVQHDGVGHFLNRSHPMLPPRHLITHLTVCL